MRLWFVCKFSTVHWVLKWITHKRYATIESSSKVESNARELIVFDLDTKTAQIIATTKIYNSNGLRKIKCTTRSEAYVICRKHFDKYSKRKKKHTKEMTTRRPIKSHWMERERLQPNEKNMNCKHVRKEWISLPSNRAVCRLLTI